MKAFKCMKAFFILQLLRIPLTGVKVRLAQEWSTNKSDWWKRAPIELSHPDKQRLLLPVYKGGNWIQDQQDPDSGDGGSVLLLFAESGECVYRDCQHGCGSQGMEEKVWILFVSRRQAM